MPFQRGEQGAHQHDQQEQLEEESGPECPGHHHCQGNVGCEEDKHGTQCREQRPATSRQRQGGEDHPHRERLGHDQVASAGLLITDCEDENAQYDDKLQSAGHQQSEADPLDREGELLRLTVVSGFTFNREFVQHVYDGTRHFAVSPAVCLRRGKDGSANGLCVILYIRVQAWQSSETLSTVSLMNLYPLKFNPRYVEKIWGGRKLQTVLGKSLPEGRQIGESWELYDFPPGVVEGTDGWTSAVIANGPLAGRTLHELVETYGRAVHGDVPLVNSEQFPILIKFLDAREDLSVQVHPPQAYVDKHPGAHLKTEAWYVLQHEPGARILKGVQPGVTREQFETAIADNTVENLVCAVPVKEGDCYFLPSGTVHALGAGILVAEVQTPSDTTFRVYDFGRLENGKPRKLHVAEALECIDFTGQPQPQQAYPHVPSHFPGAVRLVDCPFFRIEKVHRSAGVLEDIPYDQPVVWMMLQGSAELRVDGLEKPVSITRGETILFPAEMTNPTIQTQSECVWLEVTFPDRESMIQTSHLGASDT